MVPRNSVKPLELVVSAIHCLREKNGSSPQKIVRYLEGKYNVDTEVLKPHVQTGLKRGLSFGLITQKSGLYRLNDILSSPNGSSYSDISSGSSRRKFSLPSKGTKKQKLKKVVCKKGGKLSKQTPTVTQKNNNKKTKISKGRRKKRSVNSGPGKSKVQGEGKRTRQKRQGSKPRKASKVERKKKIKPELYALKSEPSIIQKRSLTHKDSEPGKTSAT